MRFREYLEGNLDATKDYVQPVAANQPQVNKYQTTMHGGKPNEFNAASWHDAVNPMYRNFKGWYDFHRGSWQEVEAAAKEDFKLGMLLNNIKQAMKKGEKMGAWGDALQKQMGTLNPNHGFGKDTMSLPNQPAQQPNNSNQPAQSKPAVDLATRLSNHENRIGNLERKVNQSSVAMPV
jgi:hypothetical protein